MAFFSYRPVRYEPTKKQTNYCGIGDPLKKNHQQHEERRGIGHKNLNFPAGVSFAIKQSMYWRRFCPILPDIVDRGRG